MLLFQFFTIVGLIGHAQRRPALDISNTATGNLALAANTTGRVNTATGSYALTSNTTGYLNTATGSSALAGNITGFYNVATGVSALFENTTGSYNTAAGNYALYANRESFNTAVGYAALINTTASQGNTAVGYNAGSKVDNGYNNIFLGDSADASAPNLYNMIVIGKGTVCSVSNRIVMGNPYTKSALAFASWGLVSDGRFKKNIRENVPGLDFINKLRPITYNLNATDLDAFLHRDSGGTVADSTAASAKTGKGVPAAVAPSDAAKAMKSKALQEKEAITYTGFVAQEVEVAAKQVGFNFSGIDAPKDSSDVYGLRYAEFVVPLVKAVQEQQQEIQALRDVNTGLQKQIDELKALKKK